MVTLTSYCLVNHPSEGPAFSRPFESLPQDVSMSHQSAYLSSVQMYLLSFLGIFFNDSVHSPSELHFVTFNIQQMRLAHVQFLILTDAELFILSAWYQTCFQLNALCLFCFSLLQLSGFSAEPLVPQLNLQDNNVSGSLLSLFAEWWNEIQNNNDLWIQAYYCNFFLGNRFSVQIMQIIISFNCPVLLLFTWKFIVLVFVNACECAVFYQQGGCLLFAILKVRNPSYFTNTEK